jgi:hypothetical protein
MYALRRAGMADVGYVLLMVGFVVLAALFTIGCDKLIGPDEAAMADQERDEIEAVRRESLT